ncbi:hypothetical protein [Nocardioides marmoraquaticus]
MSALSDETEVWGLLQYVNEHVGLPEIAVVDRDGRMLWLWFNEEGGDDLWPRAVILAGDDETASEPRDVAWSDLAFPLRVLWPEATPTGAQPGEVASSPGCDCSELCEMGPTCPGGMLARLSGWGCHRQPAALNVAEHAELEAYRAEDLRQRQWSAGLAESDVRCIDCDLRYGERDQYSCVIEGTAHRYDEAELAEARVLAPPAIPRADG